MHAHTTDGTPANSPKTLSATSAGSVCGSLDPPSRSKKTSKSGWRYIQCTNNTDELRVLLPPRPAAIYANLLKVEAHALAKNDADSLRDVQYIHYLKDAMVKRCQTLAQDEICAASETQHSRTISVVEAPLDFKLKRLEQWWEMMEAQGKTKGHSRHSKHNQGRAERSSRIHASISTTTISPNKSHAYDVSSAQANAHDNGVAQTQYIADVRSSPNVHKKRPAPLTVPSAGRTISAQSSPLMPQVPRSPNPSSRRGSVQVASSLSPVVHSPHDRSVRPQLQQGTAYRLVYTNSQMASPLETPYNPSFDPNQSLAVQQYLTSPTTSRNGMPMEAHFPTATVRNEVAPTSNDTRTNRQHVYSTADALTEPTVAQADPSHLKSRFHATYASSPSNSTSSPSSNGSKPPIYTQQNASYSREGAGAFSQAGAAPSSHIRTHGSLSMPFPNREHGSSEKDHKRRATVDCDDTDRSVPRPKAYMYRSGAIHHNTHDGSPETHYNGHSFDAQGRQAEGDYSPSAMRRVARVLNQSLIPGGSPLSSAGSQGSPRMHGSPGTRHAVEASAHSQSSPGKGSQYARSYGATLSAEHAYGHPDTGVHSRSPNLLPPDYYRARRGSNESEINATGVVSGAKGDSMNIYPKQQLRRTISRRSLREHSPAGGEPASVLVQPVVPPTDYYATQARSSRRTTIPPPDVQQPVEGDIYHRGRTRRGERSPRRRYHASPRRGEAVIPDMAILTPMTSNRNSRYTSGDSSVSEPVIPDVSLIMEAELSRNKADRVRRRLVPLQTSSEEGAYEFDELDFLSEDDDQDHEGAYYRPPYQPRDGYGSGYASEAEGAKSRAPSRLPSRSPSRGILKRSNSVCSQRSSKSVRLEIPRDRRALEEVRDAEDKVESARKQLDDLQRRKGDRAKTTDSDILKAAEALNQAKRSLKEKDDEYRAILDAMKPKRSEQDETEPRYV